MQPLRFAVSFIIYDKKKRFLVVKRSETDLELDGIWGLPATGFDPLKETFDEAVVRGGKEKLNCFIKPIRRLPLVFV